MAVDEQRRSGLFRATAEALGEEHAVTMFELLPPPATDLATQQAVDLRFDLVDERFGQVERRFDQVHERFEGVERRFEQVDQRFEQIDQRFEQVGQRLAQVDHRLDRLHDEVLGLRGELIDAVAGQGRTVVLAVITTTVAIGSLALAFAQLL